MVPDAFIVAAVAIIGLCFGSFLNVCILRLPAEQSLVRPPSTCPRCNARIAWYDNIPVVSWLVLGGKCRNCRNPISLQYPLIELLTGALWVAAYLKYGLSIHALAGALFCTALLGIMVTDARHKIIPDQFSLGGLVIGLLLSALGGKESHFQALFGAEVGFGLLWAVGWLGELALKQEAMGGGDIKMLAMVGAFVGWKGVVLTIFLGALLGTLVFGPIALVRRQARLPLPFGVFLAIAAALAFFYMDTFLRWFAAWLAWQA